MFKTTLYHSKLPPSGVVIENPAGLEDCALNLERNKYFGISEQFDAELIFHGDGLQVIETIFDQYGAHDELRIVVEFSLNEDEWQVLYAGVIDLYSLEFFYADDLTYKCKAPLLERNKWTRFISKTSQPVTLIGGSRINFPPNVLVQRYRRSTTHRLSDYAPGIGVGNYWMINTVAAEDSLSERYEYGNQVSAENPISSRKYFIRCKYGGTYRFESNIGLQMSGVPANRTVTYKIVRRRGSDDTVFSLGTYTTTGASIQTAYFNAAHDIECLTGDELYLFAEISGAISSQIIIRSDFFTGTTEFYSQLSVRAETFSNSQNIYGVAVDGCASSIISSYESQADVDTGLKAHLCYGENISNKNFYQLFTDPVSGQPWEVIIDYRPNFYFGTVFSLNFDDWYKSVFAVKPIGVDFENDKVRIRPLDFYYSEEYSAIFLNCHDITRTIDTQKIYKTITVGFEKHESNYRHDEFKTFHGKAKYNSELTVGDDLELVSKFIADSNLIEAVRRQEVDSTDIFFVETEVFETTDFFGVTIRNVNVKLPVNEGLRLSVNNTYDRYISTGIALKGRRRFYAAVDGEGEYRFGRIEYVSPYYMPVLVKFKTQLKYEDYLQVKADRYKIFSTEVGEIRLKSFKYYLSSGVAEVEGYLIESAAFLILEDESGYILLEDGNKILV